MDYDQMMGAEALGIDDQHLQPDQQNEALRRASMWFETDREAKSAIMLEFEEVYKLWRGSHWDLLDDNGTPIRTEAQKVARPNSVENMVFALVEGLVSEFSDEIQIIDYPVESGDESVAKEMTDLKEFIAYKNRLRVERTSWNRNFFMYGTGIWHTYWDPKWQGGKGPNRWVGDIRWKAVHPQLVYPDARCISDIEEGRRIHKAYYFTQEYVEEKWGVDVPPDMLRSDMLVGDDGVSEYHEETGESRVLVVETWYKGKPLIDESDSEDILDGEIGNEEFSSKRTGPGLHIIWWAGEGGTTYLGHANYVYFDEDEDVKFPFTFRQRYPRENSVWGFGEPWFLRSPQIMMNKNSEMIIEGHAFESYGQTFYGDGAFSPETEAKLLTHGTMPGMYFKAQDIQQIRREHGSPLAQSLTNEPARLQRAMETIIGRFDISQGRTPSSITAFRALDLLAARAQVRLRSAETAMVTGHEDCGNYINNLIYKCYTDQRKYRILGDDVGQKEQVYFNPDTGEEQPYSPGGAPGPEWEMQQRTKAPQYKDFDANEHKKVYLYDTDSVVPYNDFKQKMNEFQERIPGIDGIYQEGEQYEVYCPQFDVISRVSTSLPTDRAFYMEMAKELYAGGAIDGEVFWYVIQNGKFPPYEEMIVQEQEKKAQQQQMMQMQAMMQAGQGQIPGGQQQALPPGMAPAVPGLPGVEELSAEEQQSDIDAYSQIALTIQDHFSKNPEAERKFLTLSPEEQVNVIAQMLQGTGQPV